MYLALFLTNSEVSYMAKFWPRDKMNNALMFHQSVKFIPYKPNPTHPSHQKVRGAECLTQELKLKLIFWSQMHVTELLSSQVLEKGLLEK